MPQFSPEILPQIPPQIPPQFSPQISPQIPPQISPQISKIKKLLIFLLFLSIGGSACQNSVAEEMTSRRAFDYDPGHLEAPARLESSVQYGRQSAKAQSGKKSKSEKRKNKKLKKPTIAKLEDPLSYYQGIEFGKPQGEWLREVQIGDFKLQLLDPEKISSQDIVKEQERIIDFLLPMSQSDDIYAKSSSFEAKAEKAEKNILVYSLKRESAGGFIAEYESVYAVDIYSGKILSPEEIIKSCGFKPEEVYLQLYHLLRSYSDAAYARYQISGFSDQDVHFRQFLNITKNTATLAKYLTKESAFCFLPGPQAESLLFFNKNTACNFSLPSVLMNTNSIVLYKDLYSTMLQNNLVKESPGEALFIITDDFYQSDGIGNVVEEITYENAKGCIESPYVENMTRYIVARRPCSNISLATGYYENAEDIDSFVQEDILLEDISLLPGEAIAVKGPVDISSCLLFKADYYIDEVNMASLKDALYMYSEYNAENYLDFLAARYLENQSKMTSDEADDLP